MEEKKITADMLPDKCGNVIKGFYKIMYPNGKTIDELKNSEYSSLRRIAAYIEKDVTGDVE